MPYIKQGKRPEINKILAELLPLIEVDGELNYVISKFCDMYLCSYGSEAYAYYNEVIGVMTCVIQELYRRKIAKYEDKKIAENGDVYDMGITNPDVEV